MNFHDTCPHCGRVTTAYTLPLNEGLVRAFIKFADARIRLGRPVKKGELELNFGPFDRIVLLGAEVAGCFGFKGEPLELRVDMDLRKTYLLFPHPSGINLWWNEEFNVFRAKRRLREFLEAEKLTK